MVRSVTVWMIVGLCAQAGCQTTATRWRGGGTESAPLFEGMGSHHRSITTSSPMAQKYFDQGLTWYYAFNHDEAIRSFEAAANHDPQCAMAWWGVALSHGPHINNPVMPDERSWAACKAMGEAFTRAGHASPTERALITALSHRYMCPPLEKRSALDRAYADAMGELWRQNCADADVGTLYAEALMDLRPWDLWTKEGQPQPGTEEIVATLEAVLVLDPNHPGGNHLYIHTVEASPEPERATAAADRLRDLVPIAGHLRHMPAHIDIRTGQWEKACQANMRAIEADRNYTAIVPKQGFWRLYMSHNHHFLSFAAMMEGRSELALKAARDMLAGVPADWAQENAALIDPFLSIELETQMRFGRWDDILRAPEPASQFPISVALWRFMRGVSYAAKSRVAEAQIEQAAFREAVKRVPEGALFAINPAANVLAIADHVLDGEMAFRRGNLDEAIAALRQAVELEDDLIYMEPPDWVQPVRHTLGAVLVSAGRYEEAERVYREDLEYWPENGWSLFGLSKALHGQGKAQDAAEMEERFRKAWARADMSIRTTCLCVAG